jgi:hypothetical protein
LAEFNYKDKLQPGFQRFKNFSDSITLLLIKALLHYVVGLEPKHRPNFVFYALKEKAQALLKAIIIKITKQAQSQSPPGPNFFSPFWL